MAETKLLSPERLKEIAERVEKATPEFPEASGRVTLKASKAGVRTIIEAHGSRESFVNAHVIYGDGDWCAEVHGNMGLGCDGDAFAELFAASRTDIPDLLLDRRELVEMLRKLATLLEGFAGTCPACGNSGVMSISEHDSGCDGSCANCPVEVQARCGCPESVAAQLLSNPDLVSLLKEQG